jgi:phage shock protein PspC (stress-responsive transcriptional regulator)
MKEKEKILYRSKQNRLVGGICGGIGEYFDIDPTIIRIIFILITLFGGSGIILYIILWLIIPSDKKVKVSVKENAEEIKEEAKDLIEKGRIYAKKDEGRYLFGLMLALLGFLFLLDNFGIFRLENIFKLWPILLISLAFIIIFKK